MPKRHDGAGPSETLRRSHDGQSTLQWDPPGLDKPAAGVNKDTVNIRRYSSVEVDFVANQPGSTLFISRIIRTRASWAW
jgi:hypothetical protein